MNSMFDPRGQLPPSTYTRIYNEARRDLLVNECRRHQRALAARPAPPRSAEAEAALRAYWGELWKDNIEAFNREWANVTPNISTDNPTEDVTHDYIAHSA